MTYGLCNALSSLCLGFLETYTGHQVFEGIAIVTICVLQSTMGTTYDSTPWDSSHFGLFVMVGLFGLNDAVWRTMIIGNINYIYIHIYSFLSQVSIHKLKYMHMYQ